VEQYKREKTTGRKLSVRVTSIEKSSIFTNIYFSTDNLFLLTIKNQKVGGII